MRIALWKSGYTGLYFTVAEMNQLGIVTGEKVDVRITYLAKGKGKTAALVGPVWIIGKGGPELPQRYTVKAFTRKLKKFPELAGHVEVKAGFTDDLSREKFSQEVIKDFATMEAVSTWLPSVERYHVTINKAEAKPASTGRIGATNGAKTVSNAAIGSLPASASNLIPSRLAAVIERVNYIMAKNPGVITLQINKDGTLGAEVNVRVKV